MREPKRGQHVPPWILAGPVWVYFSESGKVIGLAENAYQLLHIDMRRCAAATIEAVQWLTGGAAGIAGGDALLLKLRGFAVDFKGTWFQVDHDDIKDLFR